MNNTYENWAKAKWKLLSVRLAALAALPGVAWPLIPEDIRTALPAWMVSAFAIAAAASIIYARGVPQSVGAPAPTPDA